MDSCARTYVSGAWMLHKASSVSSDLCVCGKRCGVYRGWVGWDEGKRWCFIHPFQLKATHIRTHAAAEHPQQCWCSRICFSPLFSVCAAYQISANGLCKSLASRCRQTAEVVCTPAAKSLYSAHRSLHHYSLQRYGPIMRMWSNLYYFYDIAAFSIDNIHIESPSTRRIG